MFSPNKKREYLVLSDERLKAAIDGNTIETKSRDGTPYYAYLKTPNHGLNDSAVRLIIHRAIKRHHEGAFSLDKTYRETDYTESGAVTLLNRSDTGMEAADSRAYTVCFVPKDKYLCDLIGYPHYCEIIDTASSYSEPQHFFYIEPHILDGYLSSTLSALSTLSD